jgi:hypothetical protein
MITIGLAMIRKSWNLYQNHSVSLHLAIVKLNRMPLFIRKNTPGIAEVAVDRRATEERFPALGDHRPPQKPQQAVLSLPKDRDDKMPEAYFEAIWSS